jgi:hypothetical protein
VAMIRQNCEANNLTIVFNRGDGTFQDEPVSTTITPDTPAPEVFIRVINNPARSNLDVVYELPRNCRNGELRLFNLRGQRIFSIQVDADTERAAMPVASLKSGIYLLASYSNNQLVRATKVGVIK